MRKFLAVWLSLFMLAMLQEPCFAQWVPEVGVAKIIAGSNITITPSNGQGFVTINSTGGGGSSQLTVNTPINSNTNAVINTLYPCNTSGGTFSLTLPDGTAGGNSGGIIAAWILAGGNNLTIATTAGQTVNGLASGVVVSSTTNTFYWFVCTDSSNWEMIPVVPVSSATANQFVTYTDVQGIQHTAQPAFSNLSGSITAAQMLALTNTHVYVGNGSNQPADVALSGDVSSTANTGAVTFVQPLHALNGYNTNGLFTQTSQNNFTGRTITGTASDIAVTNGSGVAGNPTLDLIATAVTPGSYTATNLTVDAFGRITAASNGAGSGNLLTVNSTITGATNAAINTLYPCDTSGGTFAVTLPDATVGGNKGGIIVVWLKTAGNTLTLNTTSAQTMNGIASGSVTTAVANTFYAFYDNGVNWNMTPLVPVSSATSHNWVQYTDAQGIQHLSQPAFTDISAGQITAAQMLALTSGTIYVGNGSNQPAVTTPTGGTGLSVTMGAGSMALANTGVTSNVAGVGITVSGGTGAVTVNRQLTVNATLTSNTNAAVGVLYPCNTSGGGFTVTLPDATTTGDKGTELVVYLKTAGNTLTFNTTSAQTINGLASGAVTTSIANTAYVFIASDANWLMLPMVPVTSATSNQFVTYTDPQGIQHTAQPAFSNLSGNITAAQMLALTNTHMYVGNGSNQAADVAMSGDATLANTGAVTLATVNSNVGSFTNTNITVNAKGLITAASNGSGGSSNLFTVNTTLTANTNAVINTLYPCDTSGGGFTVTLPDSTLTGQKGGAILVWLKTAGNTLTINTTSAQKMNGLSSGGVTTSTADTFYYFVSDAVGWNLMPVVPVGSATSHNWVQYIDAQGVAHLSQPAFTDISAGQITAAQMLALTSAHVYVGNGSNQAADVAMSGDATMANTGALTIANSAVTNAKMANMAAQSVKSNFTNASAAPSDNAASAGGQGLFSNAAGTALAFTATPQLGVAGTTAGSLTLAGVTSGTAIINTPAAAGSTTFTLPSGNGSANQFLQGNGSGALSYASANPALNGFRLTGTSVTPVTTSDVTAIGTLYFTPYLSNLCSVYNGTNWITDSSSEISFSVAATVGDLRDVFVYDNSGTLTVEDDSWASSQTTTNISAATAANPCVLTVASISGISNGSLVYISGIVGSMGTDAVKGLNGKVCVAASVSGTSVTLTAMDTTSLTYTSGGVLTVVPTSRATGLSLQNGVLSRTGSLTRRYVGTYFTGAAGTSGKTEDSSSRRLVYNYTNRIERKLSCKDTTATWTDNVNSFRCKNSNSTAGVGRVEAVTGVQEDFSHWKTMQNTYGVAGQYDYICGFGVNTITADSSDFGNDSAHAQLNGQEDTQVLTMETVLPLGYCFVQSNEIAGANNNATLYGANTTNGVSTQGNGMQGMTRQ